MMLVDNDVPQPVRPDPAPCDCGSSRAWWHGEPDGMQIYCCDRCWRRHYRAEAEEEN